MVSFRMDQEGRLFRRLLRRIPEITDKIGVNSGQRMVSSTVTPSPWPNNSDWYKWGKGWPLPHLVLPLQHHTTLGAAEVSFRSDWQWILLHSSWPRITPTAYLIMSFESLKIRVLYRPRSSRETVLLLPTSVWGWDRVDIRVRGEWRATIMLRLKCFVYLERRKKGAPGKKSLRLRRIRSSVGVRSANSELRSMHSSFDSHLQLFWI